MVPSASYILFGPSDFLLEPDQMKSQDELVGGFRPLNQPCVLCHTSFHSRPGVSPEFDMGYGSMHNPGFGVEKSTAAEDMPPLTNSKPRAHGHCG